MNTLTPRERGMINDTFLAFLRYVPENRFDYNNFYDYKHTESEMKNDFFFNRQKSV